MGKGHASRELEFRQGANPEHENTMQEAAKKLRVAQELVKPSEKRERLFLAKIDKNGPLPDQSNPHYKGLDRCWDWTGVVSKKTGYGQTHQDPPNKTPVGAHRMSYAIHIGAVGGGKFVMHRCDRRSCVNPTHLRLGSFQDNMDDRNSKGRTARGDMNGSRKHPDRVRAGILRSLKDNPGQRARGEKQGSAKLTAHQVSELRGKYSAGGTSFAKLAAEYGIAVVTVSKIIHRILWAHVK